ncbi:MAG: hypothetical protein HN509_16205 [Halobacteriovoraceae bacterium]|jgi:hypothetical protein|nr:hypothetical protein [Halobacteriovoraceae bacterium]MBT5094207.1 hypothetical protein [Halobacteriovoraceae bacterium]
MDVRENYAKKISEARNQYRDAAKDMKRQNEREIKGINKRNKVQNRQRTKSFLEQKGKLEEANLKNKTFATKKLNDTLEREQENYRSNVDNMKRGHSRDHFVTKKNYDNALSEMSESFNTSKKEKDKLTGIRLEAAKERFDRNFTKESKNFNEKLGSMQRNSQDRFEKYRDNSNDEKRDLLSSHRKVKQGLVQNANITKNKLNNKHQDEMNIMRKSHEQGLEQMTNHHRGRLMQLEKSKTQERMDTEKQFQGVTDRISKNNEASRKHQADQSIREKRSLETKFGKDRLTMERRTNELITAGQGERLTQVKRQMEDHYEDHIDDIKRNSETQKYNDHIAKERLNVGHQEEQNLRLFDFEQGLAAKDQEIRDLRIKDMGRLKEENQLNIETVQEEMLTADRQAKNRAIDNQKSSSDALKKQRVEMGRQISALNQDKQLVLADAQKEYRTEKTAYITKVRTDAHHDRAKLRNEMLNNYAKKESAMQKEIDKGKRQLANQKDLFDYRIGQQKQNSAKQVQKITSINTSKQEQDRREQLQALEQKDQVARRMLTESKDKFDLQLSKVKHRSERHIDKLTERYETQIGTERQEHKNEMEMKLGMARAEFDRLTRNATLEKETMKRQYEVKMEKLRQANVDSQEVAAKRDTISQKKV